MFILLVESRAQDSKISGRHRVHKNSIEECITELERWRKLGPRLKKKLEEGEVISDATMDAAIIKVIPEYTGGCHLCKT